MEENIEINHLYENINLYQPTIVSDKLTDKF